MLNAPLMGQDFLTLTFFSFFSRFQANHWVVKDVMELLLSDLAS